MRSAAALIPGDCFLSVRTTAAALYAIERFALLTTTSSERRPRHTVYSESVQSGLSWARLSERIFRIDSRP